MGLLFSTRRTLLESRGIKYLLRAWMGGTAAQDYADAQVLDSPGEGVLDGSLTVVEQDGTLAASGGKLAFTVQGTPAWDDQGVYSQAIIRALGRGFLCEMNESVDGSSGAIYGFTANPDAHALGYFNQPCFWIYGVGAVPVVKILTAGAAGDVEVADLVLNTDYKLATVPGGYDVNGVSWYAGQTAADYLYGSAWYIEGGVFADWTLLWRTAAGNTATLYAGLAVNNAAGVISRMRVPDRDLKAVLQPTALSTFTAPNGTSLDAITPEVGGVWTEDAGDWDIQGNRAQPNTTLQYNIATISTSIADLICDCIVRLITYDANTLPGLALRLTDTSNYWHITIAGGGNQIRIYEVNASVRTLRASAAVAIVADTDYNLRAIAYDQTIDVFVDGANKITYGSAALNETTTTHGIVSWFQAGVFESELDNFAIYSRTSPIYDATLGAV